MSLPHAGGLPNSKGAQHMSTQPNGRHTSATATRGAVAERPVAASAPAGLRRLERLFGQCDWSDRDAFAAARKRSRLHAVEVLESGGGAHEEHTALLVAAAELFRSLGNGAGDAEQG